VLGLSNLGFVSALNGGFSSLDELIYTTSQLHGASSFNFRELYNKVKKVIITEPIDACSSISEF